jgi:hypothetical protein
MGEHKRNPTAINRAAAVPGAPGLTIDLDAMEKLLAGTTRFCEHCGLELAIFPPDDFFEHLYGTHAGLIEPAFVEAWRAYQNETDLAERLEMHRSQLFGYAWQLLTVRYDLRKKCVDSGVVTLPAGSGPH